MRAVYLAGRAKKGWCCVDCGAEHRHHGRPFRTFVRVVAHKVLRHRRLPSHVYAAAQHELIHVKLALLEWRMGGDPE